MIGHRGNQDMNVLIVENEVYLAQKVASRLFEEGYHCDMVTSFHEIASDASYDAVLLSTNLPTAICDEIIKKYIDSIIILLVAYISDATVTRPIKMGADDYVLKPFVIDELIRKINMFQKHRKIAKQNDMFKNYFNFFFSNTTYSVGLLPPLMPFIVQTNDQKVCDKIVLDMAMKNSFCVKYIDCSKFDWLGQIENSKNELLYITEVHNMKKTSKDNLTVALRNKNAIIFSPQEIADIAIEKVTILSQNISQGTDRLMTINDYVKQMIARYQDIYPDTELSKKLGISRKSLWEKRKKLEVIKKK